ncbi:RNA polymerase sigma factor [Flagellimonas pacifica]|uniref:RNA polymerase sigma factor n=1 Tax=Flagellimonas pacifica TaxID=1247520 RepID=UPI0013FE4166|nr:RNA polymerase sigma-70 factor [Allomuricauda parva]
MPIEKEILTVGLKRGDERAYKNLYELYYKSLVQYCYALTGDVHRAEDIVQNVLIKIWQTRDKIEITTSLKSYLYRAVFNEFVKDAGIIKKKEKLLLELKQEVLGQVVDMDREIIEKKIKLLEEAIDQLPKKRKRVFLLSKKEGYKYKEIATELGLSEKTVEKHISRAIKQIKKIVYHDSPKIFLLFLKKHLLGFKIGNA